MNLKNGLKGMGKALKKAAAAAAALTLLAGTLTGCGNEKKDDKLRVGIVQLVENGAFEDMREGFIARMRELGYTEDQLEFDYKNAQGDATNLNTICQNMVSSKVDLVVTIATPPAQAMVNQESDIPVIFISVSNPVGAGIISDMEKPDKNATGTSNAIPVSDIFALSDKLTPGIKTCGFLYATSEINSLTTVESAKAYCEENGIAYEEAVVTNSSEVQQAAQSLVGKVDAIFVPNDSVIQNAMPQVAEVAKDAKIPVYGSSAVMVNSGAFATIAISDTEIGAISADMADQYLKGTKIEEIPSVVVPATDTVINKTTADAIGITLSDDVLSTAVLVEN